MKVTVENHLFLALGWMWRKEKGGSALGQHLSSNNLLVQGQNTAIGCGGGWNESIFPAC